MATSLNKQTNKQNPKDCLTPAAMNCLWFLSWKLEVGHWQPPSPCFRLEVWTGLTCAGLVQDLYEFMSATVMSHPEAGITQHPFPSCMLCTPLFYSVPWVVEEGFATDVPCVVNHSWSFSELSELLWAWINHSPCNKRLHWPKLRAVMMSCLKPSKQHVGGTFQNQLIESEVSSTWAQGTGQRRSRQKDSSAFC